MYLVLNYLRVLGMVVPEDGAPTAVTDAAANGAEQAAGGGGFGNMNPIFVVLMWVAVIGVFYFFSIRPQSKRDKKLKEMQSAIKTGDDVYITSGLYGKVVDVLEDRFIIEFGTNRSVRIPVRKSDVFVDQEPESSKNPVAKSESGK